MGFIAERLVKRRKNKGLKQTELADIVKISIPTITRMENGKSNPKTEDLSKIAAALNTSVAYLLGEIDDPDAIPVSRSDNLPNTGSVANSFHVSGDAFVQGNHNSVVIQNDHERPLSDDARELLRIYGTFDVKRRTELLNKLFALESEMLKCFLARRVP